MNTAYKIEDLLGRIRYTTSSNQRRQVNPKVTNVVYEYLQYADIKNSIENTKREVLKAWVL